MASLGALALAALELTPLVGVDAIGGHDLGSGDLVQVPTPGKCSGLGSLFTRLLDGIGGELFGAQGHQHMGRDDVVDDVVAKTLKKKD